MHGGYDPAASPLADRWLSLVELIARPLAACGVPPGVVTTAGLVSAAAAAPLASGEGRWRIAAATAVAGSALADGLDGSVAVLTGRATAWGHLLDSLVDRAADLCFTAALRRAGAPAGVALASAGCSAALEYARARAAAAGYGEIGVVTVGERPTRVVLTALGLAAGGLFPRRAGLWATAAGGGVAVLSAAGTVQFLRVAFRDLGQRQAGPISSATAWADSATSGSPPPG